VDLEDLHSYRRVAATDAALAGRTEHQPAPLPRTAGARRPPLGPDGDDGPCGSATTQPFVA
jgi:hypothetical protein